MLMLCMPLLQSFNKRAKYKKKGGKSTIVPMYNLKRSLSHKMGVYNKGVDVIPIWPSIKSSDVTLL